jgi:DNA-binding NtrC family response regulator
MKLPIIVIDADKSTCRSMCTLLEANQYLGIPSHSLARVENLIEKNSCRTVILDLDTVPVENRHLRELKRSYPDLYFLAVSGRKFHPELKEAISSYIYACLSKPIDPDELIYWVKSIFRVAANSADNRLEK